MGCPVVVAWWPASAYALPFESTTLLIVGVSLDTEMPTVSGVPAATAELNVPAVDVTDPAEFFDTTSVGTVNAIGYTSGQASREALGYIVHASAPTVVRP